MRERKSNGEGGRELEREDVEDNQRESAQSNPHLYAHMHTHMNMHTHAPTHTRPFPPHLPPQRTLMSICSLDPSGASIVVTFLNLLCFFYMQRNAFCYYKLH